MIEQVRLDQIKDSPYQPRSALGDVTELAESIASLGLAQPPMGRWAPDDSRQALELAFGHRRVAAVRMLAEDGRWGDTMPVDVRELSDAEMALLGLEENTARSDLNPLDQLRGWQAAAQVDGVTQADVARAAKLKPSTLSKYLSILRLPKSVLAHVRDKRLAYRTALLLVPFLCPRKDAAEGIAEALVYCTRGDRNSPVLFTALQSSIAEVVTWWGGADRGYYGEEGTSKRIWLRLTDDEQEAGDYCFHRLTKGEVYTCEGVRLRELREAEERRRLTELEDAQDGEPDEDHTAYVEARSRLQAAADKHFAARIEELAGGDTQLAETVTRGLEPDTARVIAYLVTRDVYSTSVRTHVKVDELGLDDADLDALPTYMRREVFVQADGPLLADLRAALGAHNEAPLRTAVKSALENGATDWPRIAGLAVAVALRNKLALADFEEKALGS